MKNVFAIATSKNILDYVRFEQICLALSWFLFVFGFSHEIILSRDKSLASLIVHRTPNIYYQKPRLTVSMDKSLSLNIRQPNWGVIQSRKSKEFIIVTVQDKNKNPNSINWLISFDVKERSIRSLGIALKVNIHILHMIPESLSFWDNQYMCSVNNVYDLIMLTATPVTIL